MQLKILVHLFKNYGIDLSMGMHYKKIPVEKMNLKVKKKEHERERVRPW